MRKLIFAISVLFFSCSKNQNIKLISNNLDANPADGANTGCYKIDTSNTNYTVKGLIKKVNSIENKIDNIYIPFDFDIDPPLITLSNNLYKFNLGIGNPHVAYESSNKNPNPNFQFDIYFATDTAYL